jgi:DNA-binding MarR family transcriptional regulator
MSLCFISLESNKLFNQLILDELIKNNFDDLSLSLIVIFPYIDEHENISITSLSKKLGYSRQAMHKNIKKLEDLNYITLEQESNKKEKIIHFTQKSARLMIIAKKFIAKIEDELICLLGEQELKIYKENQKKVYEYFMTKDDKARSLRNS